MWATSPQETLKRTISDCSENVSTYQSARSSISTAISTISGETSESERPEGAQSVHANLLDDPVSVPCQKFCTIQSKKWLVVGACWCLIVVVLAFLLGFVLGFVSHKLPYFSKLSPVVNVKYE